MDPGVPAENEVVDDDGCLEYDDEDDSSSSSHVPPTGDGATLATEWASEDPT